MKITNVSYARTINLGNYENERIEFSAEVEGGEDHSEVLRKLKELVGGSPQAEFKAADQSPEGYVIRNSEGKIVAAYDLASQWLKTYALAANQAANIKAFVSHNCATFLKIKDEARNNPAPRALERVQAIEQEVVGLMKEAA